MDDIEVWLRTDLVRLDFSLSSVGCGKDRPRDNPQGCSPGAGEEEGGGQVWLLQPPDPHSWRALCSVARGGRRPRQSWPSAGPRWLQNTLLSPRYFSFRFVCLSSFAFFIFCLFFVGFSVLRVCFLVFISFHCDIYTQMNGVLFFLFFVVVFLNLTREYLFH